MEPEVLIASSPTDAGISCWDLRTGAEHLHYKSCASPPHGLASVAGRFLASSQVRDAKSSTSGSILYWSWNKPQIEVRSFPAEAIRPIACNSQGTYIAGGGISGDIYFWEVATGKLLKKWHAHYRAVTCLAFNDDQSLLFSGAEDGCLRVWSLFLIFDTARREEARNLFEYSFHEHSLRVTDVKTGYGGCNAIIVSASEDRTCKVWSLSRGKLLRNIVFPSIIDVISIDPGEHVLYAGGRDGKIYIAALNAPVAHNNNYGPHIIGSLSEHGKSVTCLASSADGFLLVSGSEDGMIRVWDTRTRNIIRVFRHSKGPVNNVIITRHPQLLNPQTSASGASLRRHALALPPPLEKFANSSDENTYVKVLIGGQAASNELLDSSYISVQTMETQIKELQQQGSTAAAEVDVGRLKNEQLRSLQMIQHWETMYENLHQFCVDEILEENRPNNQHAVPRK
ncbi:Transducin/WD40 repeat-like superfamily protein [Perilla frutescens var. hirtella]|uniref:Transducin/WD40 repeat-like superfamily protein n=1 Tax=Perilla frutescens var. hirtella TaxID=608512 RepID=A0AAD4J0N7_PERFH|nr:Transducin/WD40 repeat-like superfamily protein [Perilla frutescens var. hirtella]